MGGPQNFCSHFRITPNQFRKLYPEAGIRHESNQPSRMQKKINPNQLLVDDGPILYKPNPVSYNPHNSKVVRSPFEELKPS